MGAINRVVVAALLLSVPSEALCAISLHGYSECRSV